MAKYTLTQKAVEDLSKIWDYTFEVRSENQADSYYELLIETCREIAKNPSIGKAYKDIANEILGVSVGKHIIFYRGSATKEVEIIRILHERMDLKNRLTQ
jgi:toxin ParE1/3/4